MRLGSLTMSAAIVLVMIMLALFPFNDRGMLVLSIMLAISVLLYYRSLPPYTPPRHPEL